MKFSLPFHLCPLSPLLFAVILCLMFGLTVLLSPPAFAKTVISEVLWAGSDLSSSDEWLEIAGVDASTDVSGWTLTSLNSSGVETVLFTFPAGTIIAPDQYSVISHFAAGQSRLLSEPQFLTTSMSLPNTKLLLRLRDASGQIMDEVDDGVGAPFAGENLTSPLRKSSMERVNLSGLGNDPANWITAVRLQNLDDGAAMLGTPGFSRLLNAAQSSSMSSPSSASTSSVTSDSSASSVSFSSASLASSASSVSSSASSVSSSSSQPSATCPLFDPYISLQSGATTGTEKVTLNIQILQRYGTLGSATCVTDFGDGTVSQSCNPSLHTYDRTGEYTIRVVVNAGCGDPLIRTMAVSVLPASSSASSGSSSTAAIPVLATFMNGSTLASNQEDSAAAFILSAALPNPSGKDAGREWVDITNVSGRSANLEGWSLRLPHVKKGKFTFGSVGFGIAESKRFTDSELGMTLGNTSGELSLVNPGGSAESVLTWKDARDGIVIKPPMTQRASVRARVTHVVDGDTLDVVLSGTVSRTERIRLIGIDAPELHSKDSVQMMIAKRAAEFLRDLTDGDTVTLDQGPDERDAYGRLLAFVTTSDGDLVQEMILREGLASVYVKFPFGREAEFLAYQSEAQEVRSGIWGMGGAGEQVAFVEKVSSDFAASSSAVAKQPLRLGSGQAMQPKSPKQPTTKKSAKPKTKKPTQPKTPKKPKIKKPKSPKKTTKKKTAASSSPMVMTPELMTLSELIENPEASPQVQEHSEDDTGREFPLMPVGVTFSGVMSAGAAAWRWLAKRRP